MLFSVFSGRRIKLICISIPSESVEVSWLQFVPPYLFILYNPRFLFFFGGGVEPHFNGVLKHYFG
jgi:hypothetical protein